MKQVYHSNAVTNLHIRSEIRNSNFTNLELATKFNTSVATISKWKNRKELTDNSSAPYNINYALSDIEQNLITSIRKTTWLPLDEVWEMMLEQNTTITRSSVYRTFPSVAGFSIVETTSIKFHKKREIKLRSSKNTNLVIYT